MHESANDVKQDLLIQENYSSFLFLNDAMSNFSSQKRENCLQTMDDSKMF